MVIAYLPDHERTRADIVDVAENGILCQSWVKEIVTTGKFGYESGCTFGGYSTGLIVRPFSYFLTESQKNKLRHTRLTEGKTSEREMREKMYAELRKKAESAIAARGIASNSKT